MSHSNDLPGYAAAIGGAAYYLQPAPGFLTISCPDQLAFIQRQSTNDLRLLAAGRTLETVLTTPAARIIDVLTLFLPAEQEPGGAEAGLGTLTLPGRGPSTAAYLRSRIFLWIKSLWKIPAPITP